MFHLLDQEIKAASEKICKLHEEYIDISMCVSEELQATVTVKKLHYTLLCLPPNLKKQHRKFIQEAKADIKGATSADDIMEVIGVHYDYLQYSLKYVVDLYGSNDLKDRMENYDNKMKMFRRETRLKIFAETCCTDDPEKISERFATMVSKHEIDWSTATLEDVEKFRIQLCQELSLYDFSRNLKKVVRWCVEVTWRVPRSLVTYIQNSIKPSSHSMMEHHVTTLSPLMDSSSMTAPLVY